MKNTRSGRIGIVAGAGPEAGIDLWQKILLHNRNLHGLSFQGDTSAPEVVVHSVPLLGLAMDISTHKEVLWLELYRVLMKLDASVDYLCVACNVLHYFSDRIRGLSLTARFVSIVDVTEQVISDGDDFALLSISKVIEGGQFSPYRETLAKYNLEIPNPIEMDVLVAHIKKYGGDDTLSVEMFGAILSGLRSKNIVLACTDLPLVPLSLFPNKTFYDVSDLLARRLSEYSYSDRIGLAVA